MSCVLTAGGRQFDVERYLKRSTLEVYLVGRRGEPVSTSRPKGRRYRASFCSVLVSKRDFNEFDAQIRDAIRFLKRHEREVRRLRQFEGVESAGLDFGVQLRDFVHCDVFPEELVGLAGKIGLELEVSHYPTAEGFVRRFGDAIRERGQSKGGRRRRTKR